MAKLITAPEMLELDGPLIFLAGPTQGTPSWQDEAIRQLLAAAPGAFCIASPRRPCDIEKDFTEAMYNEQVDWETRYLRRAASHGVVLFWLDRERHHECSRAHAQTTRFELAEWKEYHRRGEARLVLGIDEGFSGARYIRRRFAQECPDIRICDSVAQTCAEALLRLPGGARK